MALLPGACLSEMEGQVLKRSGMSPELSASYLTPGPQLHTHTHSLTRLMWTPLLKLRRAKFTLVVPCQKE